MTDLITAEEAEKLLDGTTPGPWELDGVRPHTAHVWPVDGCDDPITGEIDIDNAHLIAAAPDLARTVIALHAQLADAKAAVALVVERAVEIGADIAQRTRPDGFPEEASNAYHSGAMDVVYAIRALADPSGVEALAALRAERDAFEGNAKDAYERWVAERDRAEKAEAIAQRFADRHEKHLQIGAELRTERDRLAAGNKALEDKVARLVGAAEDAEYDLLQWLECSKSLIAAGFNMDGTAEVTAKLTAALSHIKRGKTNG